MPATLTADVATTDDADSAQTASVNTLANAILPVGSRKTVFLTLQAVRSSKSTQAFSQSWLREKYQVGQNRQAMRLLRFLDFLDGEHLTQEVIDRRTNLQLFRELIVERVRSGCRRVGMANQVADLIGADGKTWNAIRERLVTSPPINALKPNVQNNVLGAFKALDQVIRHLAKEGWLDNSIKSLDATGEPEQERSSEIQRSDNGNCLPVVCGSKEGKVVFARISFDSPITSQALRNIGRQLLEMADVSERSEELS